MVMKTLALVLLLSTIASAQPGQSFSSGHQPRGDYQAATGKWAHRGGTVVQKIDAQTYVITSNGPMPYRGILSASRGSQVVDGAYVLESGESIIRIQAWARNTLQVGDLVMLDSVLAPPRPAATAFTPSYSGQSSYHSTSANSDPTYRSWLSRGFTMGGISGGFGNFGGFNGGCNNW